MEIEPWDRVAPLRASDLDANRDPSFAHVILPEVVRLAGRLKGKDALDMGCGTGRLTRQIAGLGARKVVATDPSPVSADIAERYLRAVPHVEVRDQSAQDMASSDTGRFDVIIACMVLQDVVDLPGLLSATRNLCEEGASLVVAITHPFFWPQYWNYDRESWFRYDRETYISSEFRTSSVASGVATLHVHRPLSSYLGALRSSGFRVTELRETMMPAKEQRKSGVDWRFPHFMFVRARAV